LKGGGLKGERKAMSNKRTKKAWSGSRIVFGDRLLPDYHLPIAPLRLLPIVFYLLPLAYCPL